LVSSLDKYLLLFIVSTYLILLVGFYIMSNLSKLINNINEEEIFILENINLLRYISWACFLIAFISLLSTFYYYAWFIIFVVGIFMGMLLRVIKNVFSKALEIKEENDLTV
jgi:ABC-type multidrug transport system fused ATPase/permease subunit